MHWINISVATLGAPAFIGSEPLDRSTWLCLLGYCCQQENSGVIADCKAWGDRQWQQAAGVFKTEVARSSALWRWRGQTLVLWGYPKEQEIAQKAKRAGGKKGAKERWGNGVPAPKTPRSLPAPDEDPGQFKTAVTEPHFTENENLYHDISGNHEI